MFGASSIDPYIIGDTFTGANEGNNNVAGKTVSDPRLNSGQATGVFIIAGQSNCCNSVNAQITPTNATVADNLNIYDGGTYRAADPLLGCTNDMASPGNLFTRIIDKLIVANKYARVILVPVGVGGTYVNDWATGLYDRIIVADRRSAAVGLTPTAVLWMQGESDQLAGTSQSAYAASLSSLITTVRNGGCVAPWLIGKCTYASGVTSSAIQAAQAVAVNGTTIFAGADTDSLTSADRQSDNTHFNAAGADAAATVWTSAIQAAL